MVQTSHQINFDNDLYLRNRQKWTMEQLAPLLNNANADWTAIEIEARAKRLAKAAVLTWKL